MRRLPNFYGRGGFARPGVQAADGCRCAMGDADATGQAGRTIRKIIIANRFGAFLNMPQIA
jgi:hypothetical protein